MTATCTCTVQLKWLTLLSIAICIMAAWLSNASWSNVVKMSSNLELWWCCHGRDTFGGLWFLLMTFLMRFIFLFLFFSLPPGSTFVVSLSVKHVINLVWPWYKFSYSRKSQARMTPRLEWLPSHSNLRMKWLPQIIGILYLSSCISLQLRQSSCSG